MTQMKNQPIILLMKDHSIRHVIKHKDLVLLRDCKYMLVPLEDANQTFILHKPKKYMNDFQEAAISFQIIVIRYMEDGLTDYRLMTPVDIQVNSIPQLISALNSLNRIRYTNKIANSNECAESELMEFLYFHIHIKDKKGDVLFQKDIVRNPDLRAFVFEILDSIKSIYEPITQFEKGTDVYALDRYLEVTDDAWKLIKPHAYKDNTIVGIPLPFTKTFTFIQSDCLYYLSLVTSSIYYGTVIYNPNDIAGFYNEWEVSIETHRITGVRYHDLWVHETSDILEYVNFIPSIYTNLLVSAELMDYEEVTEKMIANTTIIFSLYDDCANRHEEKIEFDSKNPITLKDFYLEFMKRSGGLR